MYLLHLSVSMSSLDMEKLEWEIARSLGEDVEKADVGYRYLAGCKATGKEIGFFFMHKRS